MRVGPWLLLLMLAVACSTKEGRGGSGSGGATLIFTRLDGTTRTLSHEELAARIPLAAVESFDPNYGRKKRYRVLPLVPVLRHGLGISPQVLAKVTLLFEAADGYQARISGKSLYQGKPFLAVADRDHAGWEPIKKHNGVKPGPFYVVWTHAGGRDTKRFAWPWQVISIKPAPKDLYAATTPPKDAPTAAHAGHALFLRDCIRCHAINRQGGRLGPELNVPRNVLEYRPKKQLRDFIRNPLAFRYGNMPAQRQLSDLQLDQLLSYLSAMAHRKVDR